MASLPLRESTAPPNLVSLANLLNVHSTPASRSFIKALKSTGPKTEPWGTPLVTGCQPDLPVNWDLSRLQRPLKNNGEGSHDDIGQLFQYPGMNPIRPHRLMCIQLEQQVSNKFRIGWEFIIPPVMVFQHRALGVPGPIIGVEDRGKEGIKHLCFVYIPICEFGLEGNFKGHLVQPPCNEQGHLQLDQVAQSPDKLTLTVSRDGASTTSLGNLFQCFTTLIVKNFFLISSLNLPSFSLKPLPLVLSQQALVKSLAPSFLEAPFKY
ncbi:hypothetical protein QYF61_018451 [Mycteria americana]|uniref:Uncharacterized protein n=1 Tax=Mycteria americana TaxID=33587 RepID=A0AAN7RL26_MYCAM|nr:hypothetical protein QYF61_018451 [Mycteria americana]